MARRVGLLGGSFNPAHRAHRAISLQAMDRLGLDEVWWLVSPQNPLKSASGMAPFATRLSAARRVARHPRIRVTGIEARLGTRYAVDTAARLVRRFPKTRFVWLMGADNLAELHKWRRWRAFAAQVPIAVFARPHYVGVGLTAPAMGWLRRYRHRALGSKQWTNWEVPAIIFLHARLDPLSASSIRRRNPDWAEELVQRA